MEHIIRYPKEPLILEPEDWSEEEWVVINKLFGVKNAERIKVSDFIIHAYAEEKDKYRIQIGDVLYENSKSYNKIFKWTVVDIWFEDYLGGNKTIVKCSNGTWTKEFFVSDILAMFRTREEAEASKEATDDGKIK